MNCWSTKEKYKEPVEGEFEDAAAALRLMTKMMVDSQGS